MDDPEAQQRREKTEDFMLAEYRYFADSFWRNEEAGERRVNFFITLVTAVISALVALATRADYMLSETEYTVIVFALFALLAFGIVTLLRMIHRNSVTDEYKEKMGLVRDFFKSDKRLDGYAPFPPPKPRKVGTGGLAEMVAAINSLIVVAIGVTGMLLILSALRQLHSAGWVVALIGLASFAIAILLQVKYMERRYQKQAKKNEEKAARN